MSLPPTLKWHGYCFGMLLPNIIRRLRLMTCLDRVFGRHVVIIPSAGKAVHTREREQVS